MTRTRIIASEAQSKEERIAAPSLRPRRLDEYVGQHELIEKLVIALQAAKQRGESMEHVLLHGPPGLGKTTIAHVIAAEMGATAFTTSGPALTRGSDLVGTLKQMRDNDVLFIDEIHRLPAAVEEFIYPAMEDFRIDIKVDTGMRTRVISIPLQPFTLIGATTRAGMLTGALRSRFGMTHNLRFYTADDLVQILMRASGLLKMETIGIDALEAIAGRSRGTPRVALRLLRRVRDFAQVRAEGEVSPRVVADALDLEGVDDLGLDEPDRRYLRTLGTVYGGGPAGLDALAATLGEDAGSLEDMIEPYLLQIGFLTRTRQGRRLTEPGATHVGVALQESAKTLQADDLFATQSGD